jgi:hypothetical protein
MPAYHINIKERGKTPSKWYIKLHIAEREAVK